MSVEGKGMHRSMTAEVRPAITLFSHLIMTILFSDIPSHKTIYIFSIPKPNHLISKGKQNYLT